jgi:hypothetical protein
MPCIGEHEGDNLFSHGIGIGAGCIHYVHALLSGILRVNRVVPCAGADDDLELRQRVDDLRCDLVATHDHRVRTGIPLGQPLQILRLLLNHFVVPVGGEDLASDFVELGRDEYLLHDETPYRMFFVLER